MKAKLLTTAKGKEIKTYWDMYNAMEAVEGSYSRGRQTVAGEFVLYGNKVTIYKHWSYSGNYIVYPNSELINPIFEVILSDWYDLLDENGVIMKDDNGNELCDCILKFKPINEN